jgi:hypothetical protein
MWATELGVTGTAVADQQQHWVTWGCLLLLLLVLQLLV